MLERRRRRRICAFIRLSPTTSILKWLQTYFIIKAVTKEKVLWLLVRSSVDGSLSGLNLPQIHLVSVCVADILITVGTLHALYRRSTMFSRYNPLSLPSSIRTDSVPSVSSAEL